MVFWLLALVAVTARGLAIGEWVHSAGGVMMLGTLATLLLLPWLNVAQETLTEFQPLATAVRPCRS